MRVHAYAAGTPAASTHPDVDGGTRQGELVVIEAADVAYKVGDGSEVDVELTVSEIFGGGPGEVIVHGCREVAVTVDYTGESVTVRARPSERLSQPAELCIAGHDQRDIHAHRLAGTGGAATSSCP